MRIKLSPVKQATTISIVLLPLHTVALFSSNALQHLTIFRFFEAKVLQILIRYLGLVAGFFCWHVFIILNIRFVDIFNTVSFLLAQRAIIRAAFLLLFVISGSRVLGIAQADTFFDNERVHQVLKENVCLEACLVEGEGWKWEVLNITGPSPRVRFALVTDKTWICGSAGCPSALYKNESNQWYFLVESFSLQLRPEFFNDYPVLQMLYYPPNEPRSESRLIEWLWDGSYYNPTPEAFEAAR